MASAGLRPPGDTETSMETDGLQKTDTDDNLIIADDSPQQPSVIFKESGQPPGLQLSDKESLFKICEARLQEMKEQFALHSKEVQDLEAQGLQVHDDLRKVYERKLLKVQLEDQKLAKEMEPFTAEHVEKLNCGDWADLSAPPEPIILDIKDKDSPIIQYQKPAEVLSHYTPAKAADGSAQ